MSSCGRTVAVKPDVRLYRDATSSDRRSRGTETPGISGVRQRARRAIAFVSIRELQAMYCRDQVRDVNGISVHERLPLVSDGPEPASSRGRVERKIFGTARRYPAIQALCRLQDAARGRRHSIEAYDGRVGDEPRTGPFVGGLLPYQRRLKCCLDLVNGRIEFQLASPH